MRTARRIFALFFRRIGGEFPLLVENRSGFDIIVVVVKLDIALRTFSRPLSSLFLWSPRRCSFSSSSFSITSFLFSIVAGDGVSSSFFFSVSTCFSCYLPRNPSRTVQPVHLLPRPSPSPPSPSPPLLCSRIISDSGFILNAFSYDTTASRYIFNCISAVPFL